MKARLKINLTDAILFKDKYGFEKPVSQNYIFYKKESIIEYEFIDNYSKDEYYIMICDALTGNIPISHSLFGEAFIKLEDERDEKIKSILK